MISSQDNDINALVTTLARTLSPKGKCRRNDIAKQWIFESSTWLAQEVYEDGDSKHPIGIKLVSHEFDSRTIAFIELALALIMGQRFTVNDCVLIDEQRWGEDPPYKTYDCGYQTTYQFKGDTLRITIRHWGGARRGHRKSTAAAVIRRQGTLTWKSLCELHGSRIKSREEVQYREKENYGPPNAHLFQADEQELFGMAMHILDI